MKSSERPRIVSIGLIYVAFGWIWRRLFLVAVGDTFAVERSDFLVDVDGLVPFPEDFRFGVAGFAPCSGRLLRVVRVVGILMRSTWRNLWC